MAPKYKKGDFVIVAGFAFERPVKITDVLMIAGRLQYEVAGITDQRFLEEELVPYTICIPGEKPSNPKDLIGSDKLPLNLVPETAIALESLAFLEGALKYGQFNWRVAGVRASIYYAACRRHLGKWWNGEDKDPSTRVHHLANARACLGILIDAEVNGKLTDDRPPRIRLGAYIDSLEEEVKFLKHIFAGKNPHQYTIGEEDELNKVNL